MTITQTESGLSSPNYDALLAATANIVPQLTVQRQNPSFETYIGRISRTIATPFSMAADATTLVRAYIDQSTGTLYTEAYVSSAWTSPVSIGVSQYLGIPPKVLKNGSTWEVYSINSLGYVYRATSSDGLTWGSHTSYSSVNFVTPAFFSVVSGVIPLLYVATVNVDGTYTVVIADTSAQYVTGITWANTIYEMDVIDFTAKADDTTGTHANSDVRHCLVMSCLLPSTYTYKTVGGSPVKQAVTAGGLISFILRPPQGSRLTQVSRWYPIQIFDQWDAAIQCRTSAKIMATNSILDPSNSHDTLWVSAVGFEGDRNDVDTSYGYRVAAYYSSRDGKHWSQEQIVPLDVDTDGDGDFASSVAIVRSDTKLYMATATALVKSEGCLEFYNTPSALTMDLTTRLVSYTSSINTARSSDIVLDNRDGLLWTSFFINPGIYTIITKMSAVQVSIEEIDSIGPELRGNSRSLSENIQITTRDRMAWITDRIESAQAEQWDNQLSALDTFTDINGTADSGLAHTDTVKGVFGTTSNTLVAKPKYGESIGLHTTGAGRVQDGHCAAIFVLPTPTSFGGTNASDSPTYGGVVFRAQDKDNLWACWYNYWSGKIELIERNNGIDSIRATFTPSGAFTTRANAAASIGIRVEFKGATIKIYESTILYSAIGARYNPSYTFTQAKSTRTMLQGYVGMIVCAYSDQDQGEVTDPGPIITVTTLSGYGPMDTFQPSRYYTVDVDGYFFYGTGAIGSPSWTDLSPGSTIKNNLKNSNSEAQFDFVADPFHLHRFIMLGDQGIAINSNVHSNSWVQTAHAPLSSNGWCYHRQFPNWGTTGDLTASINVEGYFCWLESGVSNKFVYTNDNFATIHRIDLGSHMPLDLSIGQRATAWNNIYVVITFYCGDVKESTDGGQTFSLKSLPGAPVTGCSGTSDTWRAVNVPYTLAGGISNSTNKIVLSQGWENVAPYTAHHFYDLTGTWRSIAAVGGTTQQGRSRSINTLTIDGNYINIRIDGNVWRSNDGGTTWTLATTGGNTTYPNFASRLNGWPTNPAVGIMPDTTMSVSLDGFATKFDLVPGGRGAIICNAVADLTEVYDIGGVHP